MYAHFNERHDKATNGRSSDGLAPTLNVVQQQLAIKMDLQYKSVLQKSKQEGFWTRVDVNNSKRFEMQKLSAHQFVHEIGIDSAHEKRTKTAVPSCHGSI